MGDFTPFQALDNIAAARNKVQDELKHVLDHPHQDSSVNAIVGLVHLIVFKQSVDEELKRVGL